MIRYEGRSLDVLHLVSDRTCIEWEPQVCSSKRLEAEPVRWIELLPKAEQ